MKYHGVIKVLLKDINRVGKYLCNSTEKQTLQNHDFFFQCWQ